jgi:hypothetical protein
MKAKCVALLVGMYLLGATNAGAAPITYAVSEFNQDPATLKGVGIGGSITTDGTLGSIGLDNIIDWNLIATAVDPGAGITIFFNLASTNSELGTAVNITATANALTLGLAGLDPIITPPGDLFFDANGNSIEFSALPPVGGVPARTLFEVTGGLDGFGRTTDGLTFADGKVIPETPTTTPLPAALPLFATGLGGLGLLGWRRKRKARAVA